jgi:glycosyltransferase involved in cell wall biosynthesis
MNPELLTIVIPTRNRPDFIELCLRSIFERQTIIPPVIVSDNSTVEQPVIRFLQRKYGFVYVRQSGELSMTEHQNACIELATTRWVWIVHDDDELFPESVEKVLSTLSGCRDAAIVVGGVQYIDEEGKRLAEWIPKVKGTFRGEEGLLSLGLDFGTFSPGTLFTVAASGQIGGLAEVNGAAADYPFAVRLAYSHGVAFLPEFIGRYRMGHRQSTDFSTPEKAEAFLDFIMRETDLIRTVDCSASAIDRIVDYSTWETFLKVAPPWLQSHRSFVLRLTDKCLRVSPRRGEWQNRVRQQYPFLFWHLPSVTWPLFQAVKSAVPAPLRRWLRAQH